ncbi:MAG: hypothetical protein BGN91_09485 [Nitrobacter sp. 62-13]|jgi:hypothetical protein|uniref:hypothetical protein n=1 Tax=Nitrobacter sp. 62-13 TaxID=1895797 RepID=UPI0009624FC2|nr:hypothetical protein [Nitrobacter sp. 62-13]OJU25108.1 MAG: hypothetical protein BGN91_09485 [Nitrobacter sp. 62-13]
MSLLFVAPLVTGCGSASDMLSSDLLSKDADWFSRSGRLFIKNVSIETPPLTPNKPVTPDDLISADGLCPGMAPPIGAGESSALSNSAAGEPTTTAATPPVTGTVALGHTECDVTRGIGAPDNVSLSNNPHGDRVAVLTFLHGPRAGIYTFTAGRLSSIERAPEPVAPPKPERRAKKKKGAAT